MNMLASEYRTNATALSCRSRQCGSGLCAPRKRRGYLEKVGAVLRELDVPHMRAQPILRCRYTGRDTQGERQKLHRESAHTISPPERPITHPCE